MRVVSFLSAASTVGDVFDVFAGFNLINAAGIGVMATGSGRVLTSSDSSTVMPTIAMDEREIQARGAPHHHGN